MMTITKVPHPGVLLKKELLELGLNTVEAAEKLGVSRQVVSLILNEKRSISTKFCLKLAELTDKPVEYWVYAQADFDIWVASKT